MPDTQFDPGGFFQFDLAQGSVRARGGERVLLLSESVLGPLIVTAVGSGDLTAVRSMGSKLGELVANTLPGAVSSLSPAQVVGHAAAVVSMFGWGRLRLERWGDALVLEVEGLPPLDDDNLAVAALLGGMFSTLCKLEVACVPLSHSTKYIMVDPTIAEQIWAWSKGGDSLGTIVGRLGRQEGR
ncbi:MAG: hypothetical protein OXU20_20365 [Myxococcales bacterium]|nr:hypothetical protein [Myxococcales bacterium]MDD9967335.1 hypothetical protein [Myxococcales bacterium]